MEAVSRRWSVSEMMPMTIIQLNSDDAQLQQQQQQQYKHRSAAAS